VPALTAISNVRYSPSNLAMATSALGRQRYDQRVRYPAAHGHKPSVASDGFRAILRPKEAHTCSI
jgi:hypothetical protein